MDLIENHQQVGIYFFSNLYLFPYWVIFFDLPSDDIRVIPVDSPRKVRKAMSCTARGLSGYNNKN